MQPQNAFGDIAAPWFRQIAKNCPKSWFDDPMAFWLDLGALYEAKDQLRKEEIAVKKQWLKSNCTPLGFEVRRHTIRGQAHIVTMGCFSVHQDVQWGNMDDALAAFDHLMSREATINYYGA